MLLTDTTVYISNDGYIYKSDFSGRYCVVSKTKDDWRFDSLEDAIAYLEKQ